ncbi:hypothetical protein NQ318_001194 [Aromia moschata]|uniref:C2 domain-containing protein n=1 Tax=Aromia moschata TaxID=1265417 RepID=A0AAV8ZFS8_9CUCU|nr:hypothetical protein NQ318_001194 [Aromia moschata]
MLWPDSLVPLRQNNKNLALATNGINSVPKTDNSPNVPQARPIEEFWAHMSRKTADRGRPLILTCSQCIVVMNNEGEEVRSEPMSGGESDPETQLVSKCGHLEVALLYDAPMRKMTVHVLQARDVPSRDRGQSTHTQVRLILLPSKKQKHKTKIRSGENPQYMESFLLHRVNPGNVLI